MARIAGESARNPQDCGEYWEESGEMWIILRFMRINASSHSPTGRGVEFIVVCASTRLYAATSTSSTPVVVG